MLDGKIQTVRLANDKAGIRIRTPPAQGVVEMADDDVFKTCRQERMQKNHRITPPGDADEKLFAL